MSRLIAICGVDGAGKSTLLANFEQRASLTNAGFVRKERRCSVELVERFGTAGPQARRSWSQGAFAECVAIATVFDFSYHYDQVIEPALASHDYVICDRYMHCYQAYLEAVGSKWPAEHFFEKMKRADLVIHLDLPAETAFERCVNRGGAGEDEDEAVLDKFGNAYRTILTRCDQSPVVRIDATLPPEEVFARALSAVEAYAS